MTHSHRIAIIGCGIGGLAAALFLHRAGHHVSMFEQFSQPAPVGSGLVIQPVGQVVLERLGLLDAVSALGAKITRMIGHDARSGRKILDVAYDPQMNLKCGIAIHRASLFQTLFDATQRDGIPINANVCVHAVTQAPSRKVVLDNGKETGPFDLIVDAAGANSPLSPVKSRVLPYGALWGTVNWPEPAGKNDRLLRQKYLRASRMLGILPLGRMPNDAAHKATVFWSLPRDGYQQWRNQSFLDWQDAAKQLWPEFGELVSQFSSHNDLTMAQYRHGTAFRPAEPGLVHIGDAAHMTSPQLGQGANMALLDALALAYGLAQKGDLSDALSAYVKTRRAHVWAYQMLSAAFTPMYQSDSRILPLVRDRILMPLSQWGPVQNLLGRIVRGELMWPMRHLAYGADR